MTDIVDRGRHDRLKTIKKGLHGLDKRVARASWERGALLAEVADNELWREDGVSNFSAWLEDVMDISRTSALRSISVARNFNVEMAERFGTRKLAATVIYQELTAKEEKPGDVLGLNIRVRGADGVIGTVPFLKASGRQIEEACTGLRAIEKGRDEASRLEDLDADVRASAAKLDEALPPAPAGTVRGDRIVVKRGEDGRMAVSIQGIPLDELEAVIKALRKHLAAKS